VVSTVALSGVSFSRTRWAGLARGALAQLGGLSLRVVATALLARRYRLWPFVVWAAPGVWGGVLVEVLSA
jgi:hypothetical protein